MVVTTNRLQEYLAYHQHSAAMGDIDPSYNMLSYVCERFELNTEQRYWLAFVYAMTYCGASTFYVYNEFPDYENVDIGRMNRWWVSRGRAEIICQTDRRWVRSSNLFVPAVESYRKWIGGKTQHEHFLDITHGFSSPEARYDKLYKSASSLFSFGQFALFLYLEALHTITPLDLAPTSLDLNKAWSCRYGLYYAYGLDEWITDTEEPIPAERKPHTDEVWANLRERLQAVSPPPTVWQIETVLCAYRKFYRGKRYIGYYIDRQGLEIAKMEAQVKDGVAWEVLWQYRSEHYKGVDLAELSHHRLAKGLLPAWKNSRAQSTLDILRSVSWES